MTSVITQGLGASGRLIFQGYGLPLFTTSLVLAIETFQGDNSLGSVQSDAAVVGSPHDSNSAVSNDGVTAGYSASVLGDVSIQTGGEG